ncbi:MAG: tetratricopeptide repeat-containing sulfotransferase family protein [Rhodospirillaceae bacterium]
MVATTNTVEAARSLLQAGRVEDAVIVVEQLLEAKADDKDSLYILAVCRRYQSRFDDALAAIRYLKIAEPDYGRSYQEEGHIYRELGNTKAAAIAYERAVTFNPGLVASWQYLSAMRNAEGDVEAAKVAQEEAERLKALPPALVSVLSFIHEGKLKKAEQVCRNFLQNDKKHVEAMRLLADIGARLYVLDDAEFLLESCVAFDPDNRRARVDYVNVLHRRQKFELALDQARLLYDSDPLNPALETLYANERAAVGEFAEALDLYDSVLTKVPDNAHVHMVKGHALKTVGRQEEAVESYQAAYAIRMDLGDAYWSLANLKTYRFSADEHNRMANAEQEPGTTTIDRIHLCFALGKAHEDAGEFERAFSYYERGNQLKKQKTRYEADRMSEELQAQVDTCTSDLFANHSGAGSDCDAPIFIVGLPRAGSTLVEQILASHSHVKGTMELPNIPALAHKLSGRRTFEDQRRYPAVLEKLSGEELRAFGDAYVRNTEIHHKGALRFTDKMPNNFRHIGLIHLILPNAKIIDARRDAMACCFSGFKQLFAEGQEFTYGLNEIGRYYQGYVDLMAHWDMIFPGKILRVQYEDVVTDVEAQVRQILEFCDLPFEQACVDFHKTERIVRTASSEQVRQPIYSSGVDQWKNFEPFLEPLKKILSAEQPIS